MSSNPQDMQQMLARYRSLYGSQDPQVQGLGQLQQGLAGGVQPGANTTAAGANGAAQLMVALMRAKRMRDLQQQVQKPQMQQQPQMQPPAQTPPGMTTNFDQSPGTTTFFGD